MRPLWILARGLSACACCHVRLRDAWLCRTSAGLVCRPCAIATTGTAPPPLLDWPGWSRFDRRPRTLALGVKP